MRHALLLVLLLAAPGDWHAPTMCVGAQLAVVMRTAQQHEEPPDDWMCSREGFIKGGLRTPDHPCGCHAVATKESSCEDRHEDPQCATWCKSGGAHCTCPAMSCE